MSNITKIKAIKFICDNLPQDNEDWINALEDAELHDFEAEEAACEAGNSDFVIVSLYDILVALGVTECEYKQAFPHTNVNWPKQ